MALSDGAINQDIIHLPANKYRPPSYPFVADIEFAPRAIRSARARTYPSSKRAEGTVRA
jgi:hypothetical protein